MLCSGSTQNGVSVSICLLAAAEQDVGNIEEFSVTLWLLLSAGRAARRAGGKWLPDCFFIILLSPGQPCHSPSTTSFKDSGDGQSRTSLPLSHCQRRRRLEPALSVQRGKFSEVIFNSLISNKSMSLVFCLSCSNKRCPLPCWM